MTSSHNSQTGDKAIAQHLLGDLVVLPQTPPEAREGRPIKGRPEPEIFSAFDLLSEVIPPVTWLVEGLIPMGLTMLAGRPKVGKSWLGLGITLQVAEGGSALGRSCASGDVLYCALEDTKRRLQDRIRRHGATEGANRLSLTLALPNTDDGGVQQVRDWLCNVENPKAVIIDVFAKVRSSTGRRDNLYEADYQAVSLWKELADEFAIAIILIHHVRKAHAEDKLEMLSGTSGITGAADTVLVLDRDTDGSTLYGRGRDVEEFELALKFDSGHGRWENLGPVSLARRSDTRGTIIEAFGDTDQDLGASELANRTDLPRNVIEQHLRRMVASGEAEKTSRGRYRIVGT